MKKIEAIIKPFKLDEVKEEGSSLVHTVMDNYRRKETLNPTSSAEAEFLEVKA